MSTLSGPPRYVPTLTEIVHPALSSAHEFGGADTTLAARPVETQDSLTQRVLQRMDPILEQRLHQAIDQLVVEHAQALMPRLRDEIARAVRQSLIDAFEQESESLPD